MDKQYLIRLPWPDQNLNANKRLHWRKVADAKAKARGDAFALTCDMGVPAIPDAVLEFDYYPPDRRKRDCQNIPHMLKSAIDGIADGMGVDDHKFQCLFPSTFQHPVKGGCVLVTIKEGQQSMKTNKMRKAAEGQECTMRLACCNYDPATTVLCHLRMFGWAGMAQKPPDFLGVFACSSCHDALDRRTNADQWGYDDVLRALGETLIIQHKLGNLGVK